MSPKTTEEKIDEMHTALITLAGEFKSFTQMCRMKHDVMDKRVEGLDHDVNGNGKPGLMEKHQTLQERLDRLEWRLGALVAAAFFVFEVYGDKIKGIFGAQ